MALPATELDAPESASPRAPNAPPRKSRRQKEPRQSIASEWTRYRSECPSPGGISVPHGLAKKLLMAIVGEVLPRVGSVKSLKRSRREPALQPQAPAQYTAVGAKRNRLVKREP